MPLLVAMQRSQQPNETAKMQMGLTYLGIDLKRRRGVVVLSNTLNDTLELFPETDTEFFFDAINAQMTFTKDSAGRVGQVGTALVLFCPCASGRFRVRGKDCVHLSHRQLIVR